MSIFTWFSTSPAATFARRASVAKKAGRYICRTPCSMPCRSGYPLSLAEGELRRGLAKRVLLPARDGGKPDTTTGPHQRKTRRRHGGDERGYCGGPEHLANGRPTRQQ